MIVPEVSILAFQDAAGNRPSRTVRSLSARSQRGVGGELYEVFSVPALTNVTSALRHVRAPVVGCIEGDPVVTRRLVEHVLAASRLFDDFVIAVPGYDVDGLPEDQDEEDTEEPGDEGRRGTPEMLFGRARFSSLNPHGYLVAFRGSEAFFFRRSTPSRLGFPETATCAELFRCLVSRSEVRLVVLGGEGCFRANSHLPEVPSRMLPARQPLLYGAIPGDARELLRQSIGWAGVHDAVVRRAGATQWPQDVSGPAAPRVPDGQIETPSPALSVVVVGFAIPRQLENTLRTLSAAHQLNVREEDYEIVVVENRSAALLGRKSVESLGANVRYFLRDEEGVSPGPALNFGVSQARGEAVALMIDGARMVSPRVVEHVLLALRVHPRPLVVVPGYHLGPAPQHLSSLGGYDEQVEQRLLAAVEWRQDGFRLFEIASLDEATENGFLNPMLEATFLAVRRESYLAVSGADEAFVSPGGGLINLDIFERLCGLEGTRCIVLWGEGNFHQYHGGVSSRGGSRRDERLEAFRREYARLRGRAFATYDREPVLLGVHSSRAREVLEKAATLGTLRYEMILKMGRPEWPND